MLIITICTQFNYLIFRGQGKEFKDIFELCSSRFLKTIHLRYMMHKIPPKHKNPWSRGHEFYNLVRDLHLAHYSCAPNLHTRCSGVKIISKRFHAFYYMSHRACSLHKPLTSSHECHNFIWHTQFGRLMSWRKEYILTSFGSAPQLLGARK